MILIWFISFLIRHKNQENINNKFKWDICLFTRKDSFIRNFHTHFTVPNYITRWHLAARCADLLQEGGKRKMAVEGFRQPLDRLSQPVHEIHSLYKPVLMILTSHSCLSGCSSFTSKSGFLLFFISDKLSLSNS